MVLGGVYICGSCVYIIELFGRVFVKILMFDLNIKKVGCYGFGWGYG